MSDSGTSSWVERAWAAWQAGRLSGMQQAAQTWIPVEEKLPKPMTDVLVTVQRYAWSNSGKTLQPADSWVQICSMRPDKIWIDDKTTIGTRDEKKSAKFHNSEYREVTHWMPLPESPAIREKIAQEK